MKFYKVEASYYDGDESTYYSEFFCNKAKAYEEYSKQVSLAKKYQMGKLEPPVDWYDGNGSYDVYIRELETADDIDNTFVCEVE